MSFSQPSAEPVSTSPGREAPPVSPDAAAGRPFLDLIAEAYHSEGRTVPDRVLAPRHDEKTAPGRRFDETDEPLEEEKTTEDRPAHRQRSAARPLRGFVADPLTSVATDASLSPNAFHVADDEAAIRVVRARTQREYRSLPVVVGKALVRAGRGNAAKGHVDDANLEATEPDLESGSGSKAVAIRILPPVEGRFIADEGERPPDDEETLAIDVDVDIETLDRAFCGEGVVVLSGDGAGARALSGEIELSNDDIVMQRITRRPPPVPEPTQVKRAVPPPLPEFAIPPRPIAEASLEGPMTDPHGRVFTADDFVLDDSDGNGRALLEHAQMPERPDDTDPFAKVIAAEKTAGLAVGPVEHTIELSVALLEELMLLEDQDRSLTGLRTIPDLRLQDLQRLSSSHGLGFIGAFDEDDASQTAPTFAVKDFFSNSEPSTGTGPVAHLPVIVRQDPPTQPAPLGRDIVNPQARHGRDKIAKEIEVPDAPDLDTGPARSFTLTGLVLARPTDDGEHGEKKRKGHSIFAAAMKDYVEGRTKAANTNAMLALAYDPSNQVYRAAIERWGREAKAKKASSSSKTKP